MFLGRGRKTKVWCGDMPGHGNSLNESMITWQMITYNEVVAPVVVFEHANFIDTGSHCVNFICFVFRTSHNGVVPKRAYGILECCDSTKRKPQSRGCTWETRINPICRCTWSNYHIAIHFVLNTVAIVLTFVGLCCPFVQLNQELTAFQRRFVDQVKRCNSLERILEFFQEVIEQHGIPIPVSEN